MSTVYENVLAKVSAEGLHPDLFSLQLGAILAGEEATLSVVLTDMRVDPESGVRMILTVGILTPTRLIFADVVEDPDLGDTGEPVLRTGIRAIPLRSILEVRTLSHVVSPASPTARRFQAEFVTVEPGDLRLDRVTCGAVISDGTHIELEDLDMDSVEDYAQVEMCMDTVGLVGEITSNGVSLAEESTLSGDEAVESLLAFAAAVSLAIAR